EKSMTVFAVARVSLCGLLVAAVVSAPQSGSAQSRISRIYLEPFAVMPQSDALRTAIVAQLRKIPSITLTADADSADASLTGRSEIWIKGYQSLNPRSGRLPSNGTPVYGGFLSVELVDRKGDTLWSYLVTENSTADIYRSLAKQLAKHLAEALEPGRTL